MGMMINLSLYNVVYCGLSVTWRSAKVYVCPRKIRDAPVAPPTAGILKPVTLQRDPPINPSMLSLWQL